MHNKYLKEKKEEKTPHLLKYILDKQTYADVYSPEC